MLELRQDLYDAIVAHARRDHPDEACGVIAVFRLRGGAMGMNLVFVGIAAALGVYYLVKALQIKEPR